MSVKLFLGGVSPNTTTETIQAHFGRYGLVTDAIVMRDRGFGFVTFDSQDGADNALREPQQNIDGRMIDVKYAQGKPGGGGGKGGGGGGGGGGKGTAGYQGQTDKIFVGGLPQDCSDDKIQDYFMAYGNIVDAVVMKDRDTGRSRGFGFIQFDNPGPVEKVMEEYSSHKIEGKWVEVKRSVPRDQMPSPPPRSSGGKGGGGGGGGGGGCYGSSPPRGYGSMPPAMSSPGGAYVGNPYGGCGYPGYGGCGGYPGYSGYPGYAGYPGYSAPPPAAYGAYGMDPYASAYGGAYGAPPAGGKGRSSPY